MKMFRQQLKDFSMNKYYDKIENWFKKPYKDDGNVIDWFLFFGLAAFAAYAWAQVIKRIN